LPHRPGSPSPGDLEAHLVSGIKRSRTALFVFLAPAVVFYGAFFVYPAFNALRVSLYRWSGFGFDTAEFVGLANFREAVTDRWVHLAFSNNVLIMVAGGALLFGVALFFAVALTDTRIRARTFFKTHIINPIGVALLWVFVLQPRFGMLNVLLRSVGLEELTQVWLGSRGLAMACIIFMVVWYVIGFYMILLIAGFEGIPPELFAAARVDGANEWQIFRRVTLPLLRDVLVIGVIYWMISAMKIFGEVWALTRGQPANSTHTMATYMMDQALPYQSSVFRMGYGTTIAVLLFLVVFLVSLLFFRLSRREAIEY
jgi:ABC-type sugar transport system permease subunit